MRNIAIGMGDADFTVVGARLLKQEGRHFLHARGYRQRQVVLDFQVQVAPPLERGVVLRGAMAAYRKQANQQPGTCKHTVVHANLPVETVWRPGRPRASQSTWPNSSSPGVFSGRCTSACLPC